MLRPNILIFMSDQEQAQVSDPSHPCQMPNAARLAREGIRFTQAYCPTAHCCPSRATFMTGLYPSRHGIFNNVSTPSAINRGFHKGVKTFSEALKAAGYRMLFAGKWHVSGEENPADRGWEELLVTAPAGGKMYTTLDEWHHFPQETRPSYGEIARPGWGNYQLFGSYESTAANGYTDHEDYKVIIQARRALEHLRTVDDPWVLFIGAFGPHDPFIVPTKFLEQYALDQVPLPQNYQDSLRDKPNIYRRMAQQYWSQLNEVEVRDAVRHYWAYCSMVDTLFGEILDVLDDTQQSQDTMVVRLSDHGEYCGAHGLFLKGVPSFREAYHIPVIIRYPQRIQHPGREVPDFINLADFAPTFLDLAGIPVNDLSGQSLVPFFDNPENTSPNHWRTAHYTQFNGVELYYTQRAVITQEYKYVYNGFDFDELYDLKIDPLEMTNLAENSTYDDVKHGLIRQMWDYAAKERDERIFHPYGTVALAPWGPADALRQPE